MTIEEEAIVSHPFSLTSADKTLCVGAAVYAAIALAWRHVPLEALAFLAVYFPLSRIRFPWPKDPLDAVIPAVFVGMIVHGGLRLKLSPFLPACSCSSACTSGLVNRRNFHEDLSAPSSRF